MLAALRPLSANAVASKARSKGSGFISVTKMTCMQCQAWLICLCMQRVLLTCPALRARPQGITQVIDTAGGRVQNIAEFRLANTTNGYLNVEGTVRPAERSSPDDEAVRVDVKFTAFSLKLGALPALKIPLEWASPTVRRASISHFCL